MTSLLSIMNFLKLNIGNQEILILAVILIIPTILFLWALVDALTSEFVEKNNKIIWILVILLLPLLGSILYFTIGRNQKVLLRN